VDTNGFGHRLSAEVRMCSPIFQNAHSPTSQWAARPGRAILAGLADRRLVTRLRADESRHARPDNRTGSIPHAAGKGPKAGHGAHAWVVRYPGEAGRSARAETLRRRVPALPRW